MNTKSLVAGCGIAIAASSLQTATASVVALTNPGFETDVVAANGGSGVVPSGWSPLVGSHNVGDGAWLPGISGGHLSDQYYLATNNNPTAIRQNTALLWSSMSVGDTLTVGAWTTYRSDINPNANIAYFWLNGSTGGTLNSGLAAPGGAGFNVTTTGLLGGGAPGSVAAGVWTYREWSYTVTAPVLTDATDSTPWGAVQVQLGFAGGGTQIAFDDVSLNYVAIPEPSGLALCGAGLGVALLRRKRRV